MADEADKPTVKAVLAEAKRLREQAERTRRRDPFARPYDPSDATARGLSQRLGPEEAINELRRRGAQVDLEHREAEERSVRARARLDRQQRLADAQRRDRLSKMTIGQRLDEALSGLVVISEARAGQLDAAPVSRSPEESQVPLRFDEDGDIRRSQDRATRLRERALLLVAELEDEMPRTRRRIERRAA